MDCEMWLRYLLRYGKDSAVYIPELFAHGRFHANSKSVNEAVPCRRVINAFYSSMAEQFELDSKLVDQFKSLDKFEYHGKWEAIQKIDKSKLEEVMYKMFGEQFKDPSYLYRDVASYFLYLGNAKAAMTNAWEAVKLKPFNIKNYRTWFYSFRKTF
jgi:hypothetical protein